MFQLASWPSLSIVTPTLNADRYLAECLASIRAQECRELEHIVVDGGSTDRTEALARASGASWVALAEVEADGRHQCRPAPGARRRRRLAECRRSVHARQPACVAERFASAPKLDAVFGDCAVIDAHGKQLWRIQPGPYDFQRLLRRGNTLAQPAVFFHKRVFEAVGYLDEALDFGMDHELWLRLRHVHVEYVPRVLAAFRWHAASKKATNSHANWVELLRIVRRHGGGWTPWLVWLYARARFTLARQRVAGRLRQ